MVSCVRALFSVASGSGHSSHGTANRVPKNVNAPKRPFEARDEKAVDTSSPEAPGCQNLPPELRARCRDSARTRPEVAAHGRLPA